MKSTRLLVKKQNTFPQTDALPIKLSWGQFHNTKRRRFKRQIMAFTCQKCCLTLMKFHKTVLAFKTTKCGVCITNIGI